MPMCDFACRMPLREEAASSVRSKVAQSCYADVDDCLLAFPVRSWFQRGNGLCDL